MRRLRETLGLAGILVGLTASAQPVRVDSIPERATLVCDGHVVGVTPAAIDPAAVRSCSLFAEGHENLTLDVQAIHGVVARFTLSPIVAPAPPPAPACGRPDPRTGLMVPCFVAGRAVDQPAAPEARCGRVDPRSGLLVPCFPQGTSPVVARRQRPPRPGSPCLPRVSPQGLLVPCFEARVRRPGRPRASAAPLAAPCGAVDPRTGLLVPCF